MAGCAWSRTKKKRVKSNLQEEAISQAIQLYEEEEKKPEDQRLSLRAICTKVEEEWRQKKKHVRVSKDTLWRRLKGGRSSHQFNMETNSWLTAEVLATWKEAEKEQRKRNVAWRAAYKDELEAWKAERELAKSEKRKPRWGQLK